MAGCAEVVSVSQELKSRWIYRADLVFHRSSLTVPGKAYRGCQSAGILPGLVVNRIDRFSHHLPFLDFGRFVRRDREPNRIRSDKICSMCYSLVPRLSPVMQRACHLRFSKVLYSAYLSVDAYFEDTTPQQAMPVYLDTTRGQYGRQACLHL